MMSGTLPVRALPPWPRPPHPGAQAVDLPVEVKHRFSLLIVHSSSSSFSATGMIVT